MAVPSYSRPKDPKNPNEDTIIFEMSVFSSWHGVMSYKIWNLQFVESQPEAQRMMARRQ
jgi:hypothetical protein